MALKQETNSVDGVKKDYIDIVYEGGKTEVNPCFRNKEGVETKNTSGIVKGFYGAHSTAGKGVKSITVVLIDEDGDEQHINGSIGYGTRDLFNGLINNVGNKVNLGIYLNKKGYTTGSVRDEHGDFVTNLLYPFDSVDFEAIWQKVCDENGYWLAEKGKDRVFIEAKNKVSGKEAQNETNEIIDIEDVPF